MGQVYNKKNWPATGVYFWFPPDHSGGWPLKDKKVFNLKFNVMTKKELMDAVKKYLQKNPDYRDELMSWVENLELPEDEKKIDRDIEEWAKNKGD